MPSPRITVRSSESWQADCVEINSTSQPYKHIFVISGAAGCGKTSLAEYLHQNLGFPFVEGDNLHNEDSIAKMSNGEPLTDTDRWDWLVRLREQSILAMKGSELGVLVTCSALKQKYRDVLRIASYYNPSVKVHFVFLHANAALLTDRVRLRTDHYMKDNMVATQIQSLETPRSNELDILAVDASVSRNEVREAALIAVRRVLGAHNKSVKA